MNVVLKHPKHGLKVAICQQEIDYDRTHGWEVFEPVEAVPAPIFQEHPVPDFLAQNALTKRGPGRPRKEQ